MKVVVTGHLLTDAFARDLRAAFPSITFATAANRDEEAAEIEDAEVYCGSPSRELYRWARNVKWIHSPGTGIDWIANVPELIDDDVVLTCARGPHAEPIADHTFAMLLDLTHRMREIARDQDAQRWDYDAYAHRIVEIHGKTIGILAHGGIGAAVARRAVGFGMKVYAIGRHPKEKPPERRKLWGPDRLDDVLRISDVFVVTAPLTAETRGLIDRRRIGLMKPSSYLFVVSRGGIVDEAALADALRAGKLAGAGLDAFDVEPLPRTSPLWDAPNLIISPHVSALTPEMYEGRRHIFKENLRRYLAGEPFLYVCDKKAGY